MSSRSPPPAEYTWPPDGLVTSTSRTAAAVQDMEGIVDVGDKLEARLATLESDSARALEAYATKLSEARTQAAHARLAKAIAAAEETHATDIADLKHWDAAPRTWEPTLVQNPKRSGKASGARVTSARIENGDPSLGTPHDLAPRNIGALPPEPAALSNCLEDHLRRAAPSRRHA